MPPRCQLLSGSVSRPAKFLRNPLPTPRSFTISATLNGRKGGDLGAHLPVDVIPKDARIPEYPHGPALLFKQSDRGLYGGQRIQFGNNVSPDTKTKTRRYWKPNILTKSLYSIALKRKIKIKITSKVLKTMDREGGLDEYLLKESPTRIRELGPLGWALRWTLMQQPEVIARFRAEAAALGLAQEVIDQQWPTKPIGREETKLRKQTRIETEIQQAREKAEEHAQFAAEKTKVWNRQERLVAWAKEFKQQRVAPNSTFALRMAKDKMAKENREMVWAGGRTAWTEWKRGKADGSVEKAGGDEAWFAQRRASQLTKMEKAASILRERLEAQKYNAAANKDEWGAVIDSKESARV